MSLLIVLFLQIITFLAAQDDSKKPYNLLWIMFDDLRPELSVYGRSHMITPNFERLASKSVVFDYNFCQVAVCNPSRDSLLTGLRPDSVGTYNFGHSYWPHLTLPQQLVRAGYNTAGIGKIFHWETDDRGVWSFDHWDNNWYDYQGRENGIMNSSTMPDKKPEEQFRDYEFTERALKTWDQMVKQTNKPWMLGIGYKLPHLAIHVPYKYYEMYKTPDKLQSWHLSKKELRFPATTHEIAYRCCADNDFKFMNQEGAMRWNRSTYIGDINQGMTDEVHDEMMMGYCAGVTFVDKMVGKLLDFMDSRDLWSNTIVVLTSDHGMHNGEKGIWEKWTVFEEATRVPLFISHPQSPFKGQHYKFPTESIDVYATLNDLLRMEKSREATCEGVKCKPLQGKSLGPVVLGPTVYQKLYPQSSTNLLSKLKGFFSTGGKTASATEEMPALDHNFALSQVIRCAPRNQVPLNYVPYRFSKMTGEVHSHKAVRRHIWNDCDPADKKHDKEWLTTLGYSMRTPEYRYTVYFYFNRTTQLPELEVPPFEEELYDHKNETLQDFTHREIYNLGVKASYGPIMDNLRAKLVKFIRESVKFGDH